MRVHWGVEGVLIEALRECSLRQVHSGMEGVSIEAGREGVFIEAGREGVFIEAGRECSSRRRGSVR